MGPRFSPRISRTEKIADAFSRCPNHGADCDRNRTSARRYHQATKAACAALLCREFQPSEPDLSGGGEIIGLPTSARFHPGAPERERDCLLREPQINRRAGGKTNERWNKGVALSRRDGVSRTDAQSGSVLAR